MIHKFAVIGLCLILLPGCGKKGLELVPAGGTLKYADGSPVTGEVVVVRFEPTDAGKEHRVASADVQPDGSFQLYTVKPGDGATPGKFKAVVSVWKTYKGREPLAAAKYEKAATTPLEFVVAKGETNQFDLRIEPRHQPPKR
jgi:hypothetical protein